MSSSPLLSGERPSAPTLGGWKRSDIKIRQAKLWKLVPADSPINDNYSYNVTYHHNIPWADLRDSWNIVFTFFSMDTVEELFDLYAEGNGTMTPQEIKSLKDKLVYIKGNRASTYRTVPGQNYGSYMATLKDQTPGAYLSTLSEAHGLDSDEAHNLSVIVAWQLFNIVEGPKESVRTDDPGSDGFDDFQNVDRRKHLPRYTAVFALFNALKGIKTSYLLNSATAMAQNPFAGPGDALIKGWEVDVLRAIRGAKWLADKKFIPLMAKYWIPVIRDNLPPAIDGKRFNWVKRNEKPAQAAAPNPGENPAAMLA